MKKRSGRVPLHGTMARKVSVTAWITRHLQAFFYTLGQLARSPLGTLMTTAVIGIALALPTSLYVLLENAQKVSRGWDGSTQISLFLKTRVSDKEARQIAHHLQQRPELRDVRLITRVEALEEYRQLSGFETILAAFGNENPLPAVLVLEPRPSHSAPDTIRGLVEELSQRPDVDVAQFDLQWLRRLHAIMGIVQRGVVVLGALLALGVLLIIGNTIRLTIQNRHDEIAIAKLFGATDAFIRRPFLYIGVWYGLLGAILAWALVSIALWLLMNPVSALAALYYSDFLLVTMDGESTLLLLMTGASLGLIGSWLAIGRHLDAIEPS